MEQWRQYCALLPVDMHGALTAVIELSWSPPTWYRLTQPADK